MAMGSPVLSEKRFLAADAAEAGAEVMTVESTMKRALLLVMVTLAAALIPWRIFFSNLSSENFLPQVSRFIYGGMIGGFILCLIISFVPKTAPYLAVPYAFCEGVFLGALSAILESMYPGIALQAVFATFGVATVMFGLYHARIIEPSQKFRAVLIGATLGICLIYLAAIVLGFLGVQPEILKMALWGNGWLGIGFSVVVCVVAALNLILDFGLIENGAKVGAPKYMSWYSAFALLVTLVWLYLEILRLLAKLRSRD